MDFKSTSTFIMLKTSIAPPIYPLKRSNSWAKANAKNAAKRGSVEKIKPVCTGVVYF